MEGGSLGDKSGKTMVEERGEDLAQVEGDEGLQRQGGQQEEGQSADEVHGGDVKVKEGKKGVPSKRKIKQGLVFALSLPQLLYGAKGLC